MFNAFRINIKSVSRQSKNAIFRNSVSSLHNNKYFDLRKARTVSCNYFMVGSTSHGYSKSVSSRICHSQFIIPVQF